VVGRPGRAAHGGAAVAQGGARYRSTLYAVAPSRRWVMGRAQHDTVPLQATALRHCTPRAAQQKGSAAQACRR